MTEKDDILELKSEESGGIKWSKFDTTYYLATVEGEFFDLVKDEEEGVWQVWGDTETADPKLLVTADTRIQAQKAFEKLLKERAA